MRAGARLVRAIGRQTPLASFTTGEISPGPDCRSDAAFDSRIRATAITVHHPPGTCKMELRRDRRLLECCLFRYCQGPRPSSILGSFLRPRCVYRPDIEATRGAHDSAKASDRHYFGDDCHRDNLSDRCGSLRSPGGLPGQADRVGVSAKTRRCAPSVSIRQSCEHVDPRGSVQFGPESNDGRLQ